MLISAVGAYYNWADKVSAHRKAITAIDILQNHIVDWLRSRFPNALNSSRSILTQDLNILQGWEDSYSRVSEAVGHDANDETAEEDIIPELWKQTIPAFPPSPTDIHRFNEAVASRYKDRGNTYKFDRSQQDTIHYLEFFGAIESLEILLLKQQCGFSIDEKKRQQCETLLLERLTDLLQASGYDEITAETQATTRLRNYETVLKSAIASAIEKSTPGVSLEKRVHKLLHTNAGELITAKLELPSSIIDICQQEKNCTGTSEKETIVKDFLIEMTVDILKHANPKHRYHTVPFTVARNKMVYAFGEKDTSAIEKSFRPVIDGLIRDEKSAKYIRGAG